MGKFGLVSCDLIYGVNLDMTSLHLRLVRLQRLVLLGILLSGLFIVMLTTLVFHYQNNRSQSKK